MYRLPSDSPVFTRSVSLSRHVPLIVFLAALVWLGGLAWMRPLALPDEGRYVEVAWEMFRSGDRITPTLDGLPFPHKPPLFYWITAAAMHLLGAGGPP
jgi:4-amino-4-deoxy-L-arabinose transferase-like glycosyltransferase